MNQVSSSSSMQFPASSAQTAHRIAHVHRGSHFPVKTSWQRFYCVVIQDRRRFTSGRFTSGSQKRIWDLLRIALALRASMKVIANAFVFLIGLKNIARGDISDLIYNYQSRTIFVHRYFYIYDSPKLRKKNVLPFAFLQVRGSDVRTSVLYPYLLFAHAIHVQSCFKIILWCGG